MAWQEQDWGFPRSEIPFIFLILNQRRLETGTFNSPAALGVVGAVAVGCDKKNATSTEEGARAVEENVILTHLLCSSSSLSSL